jgi:TRAP transporter TAXI family solute receptor
LRKEKQISGAKFLTQRGAPLSAMRRRAIGYSGLIGLALALFAFGSALLVGGQASVPRVAFVIATGPTGGTYFPVGEAIATIVSHPPGIYRCEKPDVCGTPGLIASVRTSAGSTANVLAVNSHTVDAALAQSDVVADAMAGRGAFKNAGKQTHVRVLAGLFPEEVHLVAAKSARVKSPADLRGKRVSIGARDSGTIVTARAVLAAFRVPQRRIRATDDPSDVAAEKVLKGQLDAMFFVGGAPVPLVRELLAQGKARLVPVDGDGRVRLLKQSHDLTTAAIPPALYPNTGKLETVGVRAVFIVNDAVPPNVVYAVTKSLFHPANREALAGSHRSAQAIRLDAAAANLPAPLHPGAERFFRESGKLPKPPQKLGKT